MSSQVPINTMRQVIDVCPHAMRVPCTGTGSVIRRTESSGQIVPTRFMPQATDIVATACTNPIRSILRQADRHLPRSPSVIYVAPDGATSGACGEQVYPLRDRASVPGADRDQDRDQARARKLCSARPQGLTSGATATLFGSGATLFANGVPVLSVSLGARLVVRGLQIKLNVDTPEAIDCSTNTAAVSTMDLDDLTITRNQATDAAVKARGCDVSITNSRFDGIVHAVGAAQGSLPVHPSNVAIDRSVFDGAGAATPAMSADGSVIRLTNLLVLRGSISGTVDVQFSTLVDTPLSCISIFRTYPQVANSIAFGTGAADVGAAWLAAPTPMS